MAGKALRSTTPKANFHRLTRLLMGGGVNLLRETLDSIHSPADLPLKLADPDTDTELKKARLTQPEKDCLYPSPGKFGESKDFDISLISKLLRTICGLTPPSRGWFELPGNSDHKLEADLARINYYRNEIYAHSKTMEISDKEFVDLWEKIKEALLRIASNVCPAKRDEWKKSIDDLLCKPLTPNEERCIEELKTWHKQDLKIIDGMINLTEKVDNIEALVLDLRIRVDRLIAAGSEPLVPEPEQAEGADDPEANNPPDIDIWGVILSFKKSVDLFRQYLWRRLHLLVRGDRVGSWHITVECSSLQVLEGLWEDYRSGHLNSVAQEILITQPVLEKLGLTELKLKTFISEDQYEKGKKLLDASSDLLARISTLERENVELQEKVKAIHGTFRKERDLLATIRTLQHGNVELKAKVKALEETSGTDRDLLARISQLERENVELKEKVKAMDETFRSERDLLAGISQLERENVVLKAKVKAMDETFGSERDVLARIPKLEPKNVELKERMDVIEPPLVSGRDLLARISTLVRENVELKAKVKAIEGTFESERDLLARISKLENIELKEKVKAMEETFGSEREPENVELKEKVKAMKETFRSEREPENVELKEKVKAIEGTFESERDLLARISTLEPTNVELNERMEFISGIRVSRRGDLQRISQLEWENIELKERMKAIEGTFESERDLLARISKLERENVALNAKVKAMEETFGSERDVLARISKLEQNVELRERMEVIEQPLVSGRGIYSGQRYGFCQVIINRTTQEELVGEKDEIVHVFKMLNYRVDKATCTPSDDLKKLVQSIVARDYEHCDIFVCFILSNLTENMEMESVKGGAFNVRDLMDMFSPLNCPKLAGKPKVFIFLVHQKAAASESKYSITEKLITEVPFYGLCLFVPYGKGYLSALLNEIMSRSLHLDLLTILKEAKKSFYKKTKITIPDPVHNFRGEVFLAV